MIFATATTQGCGRFFSALLIAMLLGGCAGSAHNKTRLVLAATTSIDDTGLLDSLAASFRHAHPEIELSPIAVGTGQAITLARSGEADLILSHDSTAETALVTEGRALERRPVMYNDFIIAGPADDPAHARGTDAVNGLRSIARAKVMFVSRGDDSGTHRKELKLWKEAGIDPASAGGDWYVEAGLGMGDALLLAGQKRGYILSDRGTYLRFQERIDLPVLVEGDARLINNYGVTVMRGSKAAAAKVFSDWITGPSAQKMIGDFGKAEFGRSLFVPSANGG